MSKPIDVQTRPRVAYTTVLALGFIIERFITYAWGSDPLLFGQPATVLALYVVFLIALIVWLTTPFTPTPLPIFVTFLALMSLAWLTHLMLYRYHGDSFNYTALLYVPMLLMIGTKMPRSSEIHQGVLTFAWATSLILLVSFIFERSGWLVAKTQAAGVVAFDEARYFLPVNDLLGIEGRWTGPFGHNGDTAMMGALLLVIAVAFWSRGSWFFICTGALVLVLTNGRASIGATAIGLTILFMFSSSPMINRYPRRWRIVGGLVVLLLGAAVLFLRPAGLTGRESIWPAFLELWAQSPWTGVGGSGIATGNEISQAFGHAHSLYIEELARSGLIGFITQFVALGLGLFIAARAAGLGHPGPLAVMTTYFVTAITEPRNNWIEPSALLFLLILMVLSASVGPLSQANTPKGTVSQV